MKTKEFLVIAAMLEEAEKVPPKKRRYIKTVKIGKLNKICIGCGHKNKKCTCQPKPTT